MKLQCRLPLQVKSVAEQGQFEGIASAYNLADRDRDVILPGAFSDSLAAHQAHGTMPALLWQHKADEPIGNWLAFEDTPEGLLARGNLAMSIARARDEAYPLLKSGALSLSIGFTADPANSFTELGTRYFRAVELLEVSLVSVPANPAATIRQVKAFKDCQNIRDFESAVREALGLSAKQAKVLAARGWPALHRDEEETAIDIEKAVSLLTAATKTLRGINHV